MNWSVYKYINEVSLKNLKIIKSILKENWFVCRGINHVFGESFQEPRILPLENSPKRTRWCPTTWIYLWNVCDFAHEIVTCDGVFVCRGVHDRCLARHCHIHEDSNEFTLLSFQQQNNTSKMQEIEKHNVNY